jgi:hypothetical protein
MKNRGDSAARIGADSGEIVGQPHCMTQRPEFLTRRQAAALTSLSFSTLAHLAKSPHGPPLLRVGHRVAYRRDDLVAWMLSHQTPPPRPRGRPRKSGRSVPTAEHAT